MTLYEWLHQSPRNVVQEDYYGNMLNGPNWDKVFEELNFTSHDGFTGEKILLLD